MPSLNLCILMYKDPDIGTYLISNTRANSLATPITTLSPTHSLHFPQFDLAVLVTETKITETMKQRLQPGASEDDIVLEVRLYVCMHECMYLHTP